MASRLWIASLAASAAAIAVGLFALNAWTDRRETLEKGWTATENAVELLTQQTRAAFDASRLITDQIAAEIQRSGIDHYRGARWSELNSMADAVPQIGSVWVFDADCVLVANSLEPTPRPIGVTDRPYCAAVRSGSAEYIGEMLFGRVIGTWFFSFNRPIRKEGAFLGIAQTAMTVEYFRDFFEALDLGHDARIGIYRDDGTVVMRWPLGDGEGDRTTTEPQPARPPVPPDGAGRLEGETAAGVPVLRAQRSLERYPVVVVVEVSRADVLRPFHDRLARDGVLLGLALLVVSALCGVAMRAAGRELQSEARCRALAERLSSVLESTVEAVFVLDREWRFTYLNGPAHARFAPDRDLLGRTIWDALPELRATAFHRAFVDAASSRRPTRSDLFHPGSRSWLEADAYPFAEGLTVFLRDVTDQRRTTAELQQSVAQIESIFTSAPVGLALFDRDFRVLRINEALAASNGADAGAQVGRSLHEVRPGLAEELEPLFRRVLGGEDLVNIEVSGPTPDGHEVRTWLASYRPVRAAGGEITGVLAVVLDISQRKAAEKALRESEERLRLATTATNDGIWDYDVDAGLVTWNDTYDTLFGPRPPETRGSEDWWFERMHPDDQARVRASFDAAIAAGDDRWACEYRFVRPDGRVVHVADRAYVSRGADGRAKRIVGAMQDVTERKLAEERQQLLMREVDHRAKNALAVVQAVVRLTRARDPADFVAALEGRISALARAHSLLAASQWRGVPLRQLVEEEFAPFDDGPSRVSVEGPDVTLDPSAAQPAAMALHELATNAAKYGALSVTGGRVRVSWATDRDGSLWISWRETGGPPVSRPTRLGFGSTLVDRCVRDQLGGELRLDWHPAGFVCDIVVPPRALSSSTKAELALFPTRRTPIGAPAILVVEDEALVALELELALADLGYAVIGPAARLDEGLALARAAHPAAALLDVNVCGVVVTPLADALIEMGVGVVFCSGYSDLSGLPERLQDRPLLVKPINRAALAEALRRLLDPLSAPGDAPPPSRLANDTRS